MSKKELANKKVVKAISLGLATALTMMTPMTALADTAEPAPVEIPAESVQATQVKVPEQEKVDQTQNLADAKEEAADSESATDAASVASESLKWVTNGEALILSANGDLAEASKLGAAAARLDNDVDAAEKKADKLEGDVDKIGSAIVNVDDKMSEAEAKAGEITKTVEDLNEANTEISNTIENLTNQIATANSIAAAQDLFAQAEAAEVEAKANVEAAQATVEEKEAEFAAKLLEVKQAQADVDAAISGTEADIKAAQEKLAAAQKEAEAIKNKAEAAQKEAEKAKDAVLKTSEKQIAAAKAQVDIATDIYNAAVKANEIAEKEYTSAANAEKIAKKVADDANAVLGWAEDALNAAKSDLATDKDTLEKLEEKRDEAKEAYENAYNAWVDADKEASKLASEAYKAGKALESAQKAKNAAEGNLWKANKSKTDAETYLEEKKGEASAEQTKLEKEQEKLDAITNAQNEDAAAQDKLVAAQAADDAAQTALEEAKAEYEKYFTDRKLKEEYKGITAIDADEAAKNLQDIQNELGKYDEEQAKEALEDAKATAADLSAKYNVVFTKTDKSKANAQKFLECYLTYYSGASNVKVTYSWNEKNGFGFTVNYVDSNGRTQNNKQFTVNNNSDSDNTYFKVKSGATAKKVQEAMNAAGINKSAVDKAEADAKAAQEDIDTIADLKQKEATAQKVKTLSDAKANYEAAKAATEGEKGTAAKLAAAQKEKTETEAALAEAKKAAGYEKTETKYTWYYPFVSVKKTWVDGDEESQQKAVVAADAAVKAADKAVQDATFDLEKKSQDVELKEAELETAKGKLTDAQNAKKDADDALAKAKKDLADAEKEAWADYATLENLKKNVRDAEKAVKWAEAKVAGCQVTYNLAKKGADDANALYKAAKINANNKKKIYQGTQAAVIIAGIGKNSAEVNLNRVTAYRNGLDKAAQKKFDTKNNAYNAILNSEKIAAEKVAAAQKELEDLQAKLDALKAANLQNKVYTNVEIATLAGQVSAAKIKLDDAEKNLENIHGQVEEAAQELANTINRLTPVPYYGGGEEGEGGEDNGPAPTNRQVVSNEIDPEIAALLAQYYAALEAQNQAAVLGANRNRVTTQKVTAAVAAEEVEEAAPAEEKVEAPVKEVEEVAETPEEDIKKVVEIEDTKTALAGSLTEEEKAGMNWWWLLLVAVLGATGVAMYRNYQKKKATAQTTKSDK